MRPRYKGGVALTLLHLYEIDDPLSGAESATFYRLSTSVLQLVSITATTNHVIVITCVNAACIITNIIIIIMIITIVIIAVIIAITITCVDAASSSLSSSS